MHTYTNIHIYFCVYVHLSLYIFIYTTYPYLPPLGNLPCHAAAPVRMWDPRPVSRMGLSLVPRISVPRPGGSCTGRRCRHVPLVQPRVQGVLPGMWAGGPLSGGVHSMDARGSPGVCPHKYRCLVAVPRLRLSVRQRAEGQPIVLAPFGSSLVHSCAYGCLG